MTANLNDEAQSIITGNDSIVIKVCLDEIEGGRSLDVTGFDPTVISAGHVLIQETSTKNYKPMPVSGAAYAALPASHTYAGVLKASILTAKPFAAILVRGTVNPTAAPFPMTSILSAFQTATSNLIQFRED